MTLDNTYSYMKSKAVRYHIEVSVTLSHIESYMKSKAVSHRIEVIGPPLFRHLEWGC